MSERTNEEWIAIAKANAGRGTVDGRRLTAYVRHNPRVVVLSTPGMLPLELGHYVAVVPAAACTNGVTQDTDTVAFVDGKPLIIPGVDVTRTLQVGDRVQICAAPPPPHSGCCWVSVMDKHCGKIGTIRRLDERNAWVAVVDAPAHEYAFGYCRHHLTFFARTESAEQTAIAATYSKALQEVNALRETGVAVDAVTVDKIKRAAADKAAWDLHGRAALRRLVNCVSGLRFADTAPIAEVREARDALQAGMAALGAVERLAEEK